MQTTLLLWLCQDALFLGQPRKKPKIVQAKLIKKISHESTGPYRSDTKTVLHKIGV